MADEKEMNATRIGGLRLHNAPIELADYSEDWPILFLRDADRIRTVLGDRALRIEHVGSTSIPGLAAKPIIDILLVVPDSADEQAYLPAMEVAGYMLGCQAPLLPIPVYPVVAKVVRAALRLFPLRFAAQGVPTAIRTASAHRLARRQRSR